MHGFTVTDGSPRADPFSDLDHEADELREEFDMARRIIQGQSATYLLGQVGLRSPVDELDAGLERISEWIHQLDDAVRTRARSNVLARQMIAVVGDLHAAQADIRHASQRSSVSARTPLARVRRANDRLEAIFDRTPLGAMPTSNGCAVEIDHITTTRSH